MHDLVSFLSELRQRRVFRAAAVYAASAFVALQAADLLIPALHLPAWTMTLLVVLALCGFPVVLALAWAFDWTREGLQRAGLASAESLEPPPRTGVPRFRPSLALLGGLVLTSVLAGGAFVALRTSSGTPDLFEMRVVVIPFENRTGDPTLDPVGSMAADWITQGLSHTSLTDVVPATAALTSLRYVDSVAVPAGRERLRALGEETRAGIVVSGAFYRSGDSLQFRTEITDVRRGMLLRALEPVAGLVGAPLSAIEQLRQNTLAALAPFVDERLVPFAEAGSQPPSYEAYRDYTVGMERYIARDYRSATSLFQRAFERDSSYTLPLLFAALSHDLMGDKASADSLTRILLPTRERLAPYDQAMLDMLRGFYENDNGKSFEAGKRIARLAPGTGLHAHTVCAAWISLNRPREALQIASGIDWSRGELRGLPWAKACLTRAHHLLGDYRQELQLARQARLLDPGNSRYFWAEGMALAALGRVDEISKLVDDVLVLPERDGQFIAGRVMVFFAREVRVHGYPAEAHMLYNRAVDWFQAEAPKGRTCWQGNFVEALYGAERWHEAQVLASELAAEDPKDIHCQGYLGVLAARRGNTAEAERISAWLAVQNPSYHQGWHVYWRARIAAQLGRREEAVRLLRQALSQGALMHVNGMFHEDSDLEPLHGYPPFEELMRPRG